jgi:HAD superfamily hydrolase (TIGR01509 family)
MMATALNWQSSGRKAVIFDFDGLILDTETPEVQLWQQAFARHNLEFDLEAYLKIIGTAYPRSYRPEEILADHLANGQTPAEIFAQVHFEAARIIQNSPALPGVCEVLAQAEACGAYKAVGSSSPASWVRTHLANLGLLERFDVIVTQDDVSFAKPAPDIFLRVLQKLEVAPDKALVLEDSLNGVRAARAAGIRVIAVPNSVTRHQDFHEASAVLSSLRDLDLKRQLC